MTAEDNHDLVVLVDDTGAIVGAESKDTVHHRSTPLHLAFSCYLFDAAGRVLMTRRALSKKTWPGVWTNSCCGHPQPGEDTGAAVLRRVSQELGIRARDVQPVLPEFRYRARAADGTVENEICPVFRARVDDDPRPDPAEVLEWRWAPWSEVAHLATRTPWVLSPWAAAQVQRWPEHIRSGEVSR